MAGVVAKCHQQNTLEGAGQWQCRGRERGAQEKAAAQGLEIHGNSSLTHTHTPTRQRVCVWGHGVSIKLAVDCLYLDINAFVLGIDFPLLSITGCIREEDLIQV